ncbi:hypothetical protein GQ43DRAFT_474056 [Delitschia confertaspora ATCC 74209]|uniref:HIT-type domain-containing protein n=1 Tax=Delitschia confertaspora ATCC 74209 TaxID=1513339 RepID=A0A9P4JLJ5_9PLEO|nr:hypothetical protein GQ43DRAFT_474056 [Delitschia confertaspora ATCC 74209]
MPLIEVLPNSGAVRAPGYAYVADTGYDPSKVAINPKDRKRVSHRPGGPPSGNELSARQQTAIARRIAELQRDNDPKQIINPPVKPIPKTSATKKILLSNKTIKNWLDDEEAMLQLQQQAPPPRDPARAARALVNRRLSTLASVPGTPFEANSPVPSIPAAIPRIEDATMSDDPLLSISKSVPREPDRAEIEALLAVPPLPYSASFATSSAGGTPQRFFCDNCGYWGRIRCLKCGTRVCGLECKDAHEGTRCLKWA